MLFTLSVSTCQHPIVAHRPPALLSGVNHFVRRDVGHDAKFWRLAQALSALYPTGSDEKRWVDGVLARKKGLGL